MLPEKIQKDSNSLDEKNDCAVKAVAIVANHPYKYTHRLFAAAGRKSKRATSFYITQKVLKSLGCHIKRTTRFNARTVRTLERQLPTKGRFLIRTKDHILAVIDGKIIDWTKGRLHRVCYIYEVSL
jgi:hypothetical protein